MAKYINREELVGWLKRIPLKDLSDGLGLCRVIMEEDFKHAIRTIPDGTIIDVAPVRHGRWICKYDPTYGLTDITCSRCRDARSIEGCYEGTNGESLWDQENYCPNCGARMDGGYD